jgi:protein-disulfide isomerase
VSREAKILTAILVVIVGGLIALFVATNQPDAATGPQADHATLIKGDSHKTGAGAVEVVEFGDYQCPACGNAYPWTKKILADYQGKITFYFRNFPLTNLHPNALAGANAAEEAAVQGKFWEMHDKLYESQAEWATLAPEAVVAKFGDYATALGLDADKLKSAVTNQTYKDLISRDVTDGNTLQVNATPTFYVDGRKVDKPGEQGVRDAIDAALKNHK